MGPSLYESLGLRGRWGVALNTAISNSMNAILYLSICYSKDEPIRITHRTTDHKNSHGAPLSAYERSRPFWRSTVEDYAAIGSCFRDGIQHVGTHTRAPDPQIAPLPLTRVLRNYSFRFDVVQVVNKREFFQLSSVRPR